MAEKFGGKTRAQWDAYSRNLTRGRPGTDLYRMHEEQNPAQRRSTGHNKAATLRGRLLNQSRKRLMAGMDVSVSDYKERKYKDTGPHPRPRNPVPSWGSSRGTQA